MAAVNDVPQLVDKKGGSYAASALKLDPGKFNKWKKQMLYYLARMEPYYLKCIKDGPFQPKIVDDDIMELVISCVLAKETWTDLVHSFEGPSNTKENRIMDLKLKYQTFKAKSTESLSQTYTRYKTLLNKLANNGVNLSKHEINISMKVPESQAVNESLKPTEASTDPESSNDSEAEAITPLPPLNILEGASPSSEVMSLTFQPHSPKERPDLGIKKHTKLETQDSSNKSVSGTVTVSETKQTTPSVPTEDSLLHDMQREDHRTSDHELYIASLKGVRTTRLSRISLMIVETTLSVKSVEAMITLPQDTIVMIHVEALYTPPLTTMSLITSKERHIRKPIWYLDSGCSRSMTGVKSYLYKYVEQPEPRRNDVYVLDMSSLSLNGARFFAKASETDNGTEFRNHKLESFCDEKGISQNFSSPYTPEQNGVAERNNITLIEAARTMLNGLVLSKHFWTEAVRITCYTLNRSIIVKSHDKTPYEIFRERILDISYFHVFGYPVFIRNYKDHLGKFDAKADDGYFLGYFFVSKAFRVFNTIRQKVEETYHVTFDESVKAIRFTNTSVDEIGINDSTRYPPDEFLQEDDPSRQYQVDS
ncbi:retrovirus-related pol polyprotein from transposon TNT 1-94 [Tanacetum coccineum]